MMKPCIHETRLAFLLRVAIAHIREHANDAVTEYDETECDGSCLADELQAELDMLPAKQEPEESPRFRLLAVGELTQPGDQFKENPNWITTQRVGRLIHAGLVGSYRRPIASSQPPPVCPPHEWQNTPQGSRCRICGATCPF